MPHVIVQSSPNVTIKHPESLLKSLNKTLWETKHFAKPQDIKSCILDVDAFLVGIEDDQQEQGFVHVEVKLMAGRSDAVRADLADKVLQCLQDNLSTELSSRISVQYCVEIVELSEAYKKAWSK